MSSATVEGRRGTDDAQTSGIGAQIVVLALGGALVVGGALVAGGTGSVAALAGFGVILFALLGRRVLGWRLLLSVVLAVVLVVPARRIVLGFQLPFEPEPYRLVLASVLVLWVVALLIDPAVRLRHTRLDWPFGLVCAAVLISELTNPTLVDVYGANVVKALSLFLSFALLYYFVASVFTTRADVEFLVRAVVVATTFVAATALMERITRFNVFALEQHLPGLTYVSDVTAAVATDRGGAARVLASAEHPIALGGLFAIVTPLALYLVAQSRVWLLPTGILLLASAATVSRTPIVMLCAVALVFAVARPRVAVRFLPVVPVLLAVMYLFLPSVIGPSVRAFFPSGGLLEEQSTDFAEGGSATAGRLSDLRPAFANIQDRPFFGFGLGTRVVDTKRSAAFLPDGRYGGVLDNQWLGSLLDIGIIGVGALLWLFVAAYRRFMEVARADEGEDGWLATSFAATTAAFGAGMLFFDVFAFVQVTMIFFLVLGIGAVFLSNLRTLDLVEPETPKIVSTIRRRFASLSQERPNDPALPEGRQP